MEMKAKKMPGLELITTQPKEMIELEEGAGFVILVMVYWSFLILAAIQVLMAYVCWRLLMPSLKQRGLVRVRSKHLRYK